MDEDRIFLPVRLQYGDRTLPIRSRPQRYAHANFPQIVESYRFLACSNLRRIALLVIDLIARYLRLLGYWNPRVLL